MQECSNSRTTNVAGVLLVVALLAVGTSCTSRKSAGDLQELSVCAVYGPYEACDTAPQADCKTMTQAGHQSFDAAYADYAHVLRGAVTQEGLLECRKQKLDSLDDLKRHYGSTFIATLPSFMQERFDPEWDQWEEWRIFAAKYRQGDELWYFVCPASNGDNHTRRRGYLVVREGKLHAMLLNQRVIFHATYADYEALLADVATPEDLLAWRQDEFDSMKQLKEHHRRESERHAVSIRIEPQCRSEEASEVYERWNHWQVFERRYREGDELWYFDASAAHPNGSAGCCGYLITRDGRVHGVIVVALNLVPR